MWKNTTPCTELPRDFCAGIGPLQLGVVLVFFRINIIISRIFHPLKLVYVTLEVLCKKNGPFHQHLKGATTPSYIAQNARKHTDFRALTIFCTYVGIKMRPI